MPRGNIEKRGENVWRIRIFLGTDADGKQLYHRETVRGTKKAAQTRLTELLRELDTGGYVEPTKLTLGEFLERWLRDYVKPKLKPTTASRYASITDQHLIPALGHIPLAKLRPADLQRYYAEAEKRGRLDGRGHSLSPATIRKHHVVIHRALEIAVKWGLVARNVADAVELPEIRREKFDVWTAEEVNTFLTAIADHRMMPLYATAIMTGMRRGELFGLRWSDVDLDEGWIYVRNTRVIVDGKVSEGDPKTEAGERRIAIADRLVSILRKHRAAMAKEKLLMGERYHDSGFVFCHYDGRPANPSNVTKRQFPELIKKAGVKRIRFHDLRHTHATLLLQAGVHPKVVSERLGHSSIRITMDTYSHVLPSVQREAADAFERLIAPKSKAI